MIDYLVLHVTLTDDSVAKHEYASSICNASRSDIHEVNEGLKCLRLSVAAFLIPAKIYERIRRGSSIPFKALPRQRQSGGGDVWRRLFGIYEGYTAEVACHQDLQTRKGGFGCPIGLRA